MRKLIRDLIPQISKNNLDLSTCTSYEEYTYLIKEKLIEEGLEVKQANTREQLLEEIADVYEVLDALLVHCDIDQSEVQTVKEQKKQERGGFSAGFILTQG